MWYIGVEESTRCGQEPMLEIMTRRGLWLVEIPRGTSKVLRSDREVPARAKRRRYFDFLTLMVQP